MYCSSLIIIIIITLGILSWTGIFFMVPCYLLPSEKNCHAKENGRQKKMELEPCLRNVQYIRLHKK